MLTLLTALRHRSAIRTALQGRDEATLQPIIKWLTRYISDPRYLSVTIDVGVLLLDLYSEHMGQSRDIDFLVKRLHGKVRREVEQAQQACQTGGMLGLLMAGEEGLPEDS